MVVLREYESVILDLPRNRAEALQQSGFVSVDPAPAGRWRVTASSFAGTLVLGDLKLMIRPKINSENLFMLLEPGLPPHAWRQEAFDYDISSDLLPSVVAFFARTTETTLGRGVLRAYRSVAEPLVALRGRLDVAGQFRRAGVMTPVACTYDEFSQDIMENQVLRAAIRRALNIPGIAAAERQRLRRLLVALEGVSDRAIRPETIDHIHLTRLNRHYAPALSLAKLILADLTLTDALGTTSASSFMVDLNDLFQRFITERLRRLLSGRIDVVDEPTVHLGVGRRIPMQPDLVFREPAGGDVCYVGDIKYKTAVQARGASADYYQLLAYTTALNLREGVLIYCRRPGDPAHRTVVVNHAGHRLVLRSIDLTGPPSEVEKELTILADEIAAAAHQVAA